MYVCVCNGVTERHVEQAVSNGAKTLRDLRMTLGVASECGRCACFARDCLRSTLAEQTRTAETTGNAVFAPSFSFAAEAL